MVLFDVLGYADTSLTPVLYIIQSIWCLLVFLPFIFIVRCWSKFSWLRNTRTLFTMYLSGIDSASRLIFFFYYLLRLIMIDDKGLWMDDRRGLLKLPCNYTIVNSTLDDPCRGENLISRSNCLTFSLFLYWASTWPMTSILLLQIHALVASIAPSKYERNVTLKFASLTMLAAFLVDFILGVLAYVELKQSYVNADQPEIMDGCKFEYFSRLSVINSTYVLILLCCIGGLTLVQLAISIANKRRQKNFVNAAANSPLHGWITMSLRERVLTVVIMVTGIGSFNLFITHFIVYLVQGNSVLRQILNITISVFSFIGPIELMWFNIDIRKAVFILLFGRKNDRVDEESKKEDSTGTPASTSTDSLSNKTETDSESDPEKMIKV